MRSNKQSIAEPVPHVMTKSGGRAAVGLFAALILAATSVISSETDQAVVANMHEKGSAQVKGMSRDGVSPVDELVAEVEELVPGFGRLAVEIGFGQIRSRPGLDVKQREIATLAALTVLGTQKELRLHVETALNVGLTKQQIVEVLLQQVVYAGFPRAIDALLVAKDVFKERGL